MTLAPETESKTWIRNHTPVFCGRNYSCMSKIPASGINVLIFSPYFHFFLVTAHCNQLHGAVMDAVSADLSFLGLLHIDREQKQVGIH